MNKTLLKSIALLSLIVSAIWAVKSNFDYEPTLAVLGASSASISAFVYTEMNGKHRTGKYKNDKRLSTTGRAWIVVISIVCFLFIVKYYFEKTIKETKINEAIIYLNINANNCKEEVLDYLNLISTTDSIKYESLNKSLLLFDTLQKQEVAAFKEEKYVEALDLRKKITYVRFIQFQLMDKSYYPSSGYAKDAFEEIPNTYPGLPPNNIIKNKYLAKIWTRHYTNRQIQVTRLDSTYTIVLSEIDKIKFKKKENFDYTTLATTVHSKNSTTILLNKIIKRESPLLGAILVFHESFHIGDTLVGQNEEVIASAIEAYQYMEMIGRIPNDEAEKFVGMNSVLSQRYNLFALMVLFSGSHPGKIGIKQRFHNSNVLNGATISAKSFEDYIRKSYSYLPDIDTPGNQMLDGVISKITGREHKNLKFDRNTIDLIDKHFEYKLDERTFGRFMSFFKIDVKF